jgi:hypothetical protein
MWAKKISINNNAKCIVRSNKNSFISLITTFAIVVILISILPVFAEPGSGYTNTTKKCISCHNDTGYPQDTDMDGVAAPYKRPHNNNTSCESCHGADPHTVKFIQPDGTYGSKSTAASCPACHQVAINNSNFTQAFKIPVTLKHSSDPANGSVWGTYWNNTDSKAACIYCHNKTLHDIFPLGRILAWSPDYVMNTSIGSNYTCAGCHYKGSSDYINMTSSFASAVLPIPPEITNGSSWNGTKGKYFNHSLGDYTDNGCKPCHGGSLSVDAKMSEFLHNVDFADMKNCLGCHRPNGAGPEINTNDLGNHINLNTTVGGNDTLTSEDCRMCHYSDPHAGPNVSNTYYCIDCHNATVGGFKGSVQAPSALRFNVNKHGVNQCVECHIADGKYHRGNPRGSVANSTYSNRYTPLAGNGNYTDCGDCHYAASLDDAPFYGPGGGGHVKSNGDGTCANGGGPSCHAGGSTMVATMHKLSPKDGGNKPAVTVPTLSSLTVVKGLDVKVNTTVSVSSLYEFVDGAQYRITMPDNTEIKSWTPMLAVDGNFNGTKENATSTIQTSNLNSGSYKIEVRGMAGGPAQNPLIRYYPINGDISTSKNTSLTVEAQNGYINGTITNRAGGFIQGATISITNKSTTSDVDGKYSLIALPGPYDVTASNQPTHFDNITSGVSVTALNTTYVNITLDTKPTGNISGVVTNI